MNSFVPSFTGASIPDTHTATDWFDRVYTDPLYLELYEAEDARRAEREAASAARLCGAAPGARWLDLCCGFGRHAEPLVRDSFQIVGVDRSPLLLSRARARAHDAKLRIPYVRGDIRSLPFHDRFDVASLLFDSFGFFERDEDHRDALLSIGACLRDRGVLLIELTSRDEWLRRFRRASEEHIGPYRVRRVPHIDLPAGRLTWEQQVSGPTVERSWPFRIRLLTAVELAAWLRSSGFCDLRYYGNWEGAAYTVGAPCLIVRARKASFREPPA